MSNDWDFYMLRVDDMPASIMVDLGIRNSAQFRSHPMMGYLRVFMQQANENGLSTDKEFPILCEIGDSIDAVLKKAGEQHIYVGRNTSDSKRDFFFYTNDLIALEDVLSEVREKFGHYEFETGGREDKDWNVYLDFLFPKPLDYQRIMNRRVCDTLKQENDNFDVAREIDHRVYFDSKNNLEKFSKYVLEQGFNVTHKGRTKPLIGQRFVDFKRMDSPNNINDIVDDIFQKSVELNGDYDGWGCEVQR